MKKSPARMNSWIPMSFAKSRPTSKAFASASIAPNGAKIFLLKASSILPSSSRIIMPRPTAFYVEKMAPSTFTLNKFASGDDQVLLSSIGVALHVASITALYSSKYWVAQWTNTILDFLISPFLTVRVCALKSNLLACYKLLNCLIIWDYL